MKRIDFVNGQLYTETRFKFQGKVQTIERMMIDTSAPQTVISEQLALKLGIEKLDINQQEEMDSLSVGPLKVSQFPVIISDVHEEGVLGLDFLKKVGAKINLDAMTISSSRT
ncbi:retroviral-like aspartic protease family protein [Salipaludibacillus sp. CUR1]|uniref:retropepsin-like aspartic protease n=1 Tax=Salipaludibacillus sp. CUR1 TaxID=2820003 RepID=UPI001E29D6F4|nr:retropepsin-like aspartic protease [Salipaludibacillus sp. CUR1]MCE7791924.1 retroviral-like aspartic protease family protein [Salipaludibacillus sp. CUR1]